MSVENFEWFGLHKLKRIIVVEGVVTNVEPLRVGSGREVMPHGPSDLPVVKVRKAGGEEVPLIPGSSWKGAFRAYSVKLMRSVGLNVCDGIPKASCLRGNEFYEYEKAGISYSDYVRLIAEGTIRICLACLIFGSPGIASHVRFYDSYPIGSYALGYRTMVAIDRRTGAARRRALFTVEYVEPGAEFDFSMELMNMPNYAVGVLAETLLDMDMGLLKMGGLKTRGFGWVRIESLNIRVVDYAEGGAKVISGSVPPLDPIDVEVKLSRDWKETLRNFANAWRSSVNALRRISEANWRWTACLQR